MDILFITRRYPPCYGGIESHSYHLHSQLSREHTVTLMALRRQSKLHLAWFLPLALCRAMVALFRNRSTLVYFSDGVVCALAPLLRIFFKSPFLVTIHGLELTYGQFLIRRLMQWGVHCCDQVVVNSCLTREITAGSGVPRKKITVVYEGVEPYQIKPEHEKILKRVFEKKHKLVFGNQRILLSYGRQIRRKGLAAFLHKGMPMLAPDIKLIIGGRGPEIPELINVRKAVNLESRVIILGAVLESELAMLRRAADLFIMPNLAIPNDVEGFGIAPLECMAVGTPAVAFKVDALVESVREGGYLIAPEDYATLVHTIHKYFSLSPDQKQDKRNEARDYVKREYGWASVAEKYLDIFATGQSQ